jgi:hypothetical protein
VLKLRRGVVVQADPLTVEVGGEERRAWADERLVGACEVGDEVVVNTAALDLALGSGGFDIVHVNLTRGLEGGQTPEGVHVMKLNYTSLQHAVDPIEAPAGSPTRPDRRIPVLVLPLHGHLAPVAWAFAQAGGEGLGYVQSPGAALPGSMSRDVDALRDRGLLAGTVSAGPCFGAEFEAISVVGAMHAAAVELGWEAIVVGPGPGILGSASRYGHGGMSALDSAHAGLALGLPVLLSPRMSSGEERDRHLGLSHHTRSVLELLLAGVRVPVPAELDALWPKGAGLSSADAVADACGDAHQAVPAEADLDGYAASSLPIRTMGRDLDEDRLFFAAPLASGTALASVA